MQEEIFSLNKIYELTRKDPINNFNNIIIKIIENAMIT